MPNHSENFNVYICFHSEITISKDSTFETIAYIREELRNILTCSWVYSLVKKH